MFASEAIDFLADRVQQQARTENVVLSATEIRMLHWSEVEPDGVCDPELNADFEAQYDTEEYEGKISGLLKRAFEADKPDQARRDRWDEANQALESHDYYLMIMLPQSRPRKPLAEKHPVRDNLIYLAVGIGIAVILLYVVAQR